MLSIGGATTRVYSLVFVLIACPVPMGGRNIGPKIAAILSIFETCKRVQINLRAYPNDVHPKLPACPISKVADFSPLRWRSV